MRIRLWPLFWLGVAGFSCHAQFTRQDPATATAALQNGTLVIWRLNGASMPAPGVPLDIGYHEQTAGTFGRTAGSVGTAASNTGTAAGSFGRKSSDAGQAAGSYGQSAGGFGTAASNTGQTAGSYGESPSDLGPGPGSVSRNAGDYNQASNSLSPGVASSYEGASRTTQPGFGGIIADVSSIHRFFPYLRIRVVDVNTENLHSLLASVEAVDYPDLIVGAPLPEAWTRDDAALEREFGLSRLGSIGVAELYYSTAMNAPGVVQVSILKRAPHPSVARAFVVWLRDGDLRFSPWPGPGYVSLPAVSTPSRRTASPSTGNNRKPNRPSSDPVLDLAAGAVQSVLRSEEIIDRDPDLAEFSNSVASARALLPSIPFQPPPSSRASMSFKALRPASSSWLLCAASPPVPMRLESSIPWWSCGSRTTEA